ncbi:MFS transporter [Nocardia sp. NPDC006630]|uniref:MFS transporter n=1 Tax=Nocardia sp. NPDC006630 TaxID=3157181 RepID=UPI0033A8531E
MTTVSVPATPVRSLAPFASTVFRALWIAQLVSNLGTWMQVVGAQWLLVDEPNAALLVSLVQTASTLPVVLMVVPAGVLADLVDRRRLLIVSESAMAVVAAILTVSTALGQTTPMVLLLLLFLVGCGQALSLPIWQAIQPELVPREQIPAASALNGLSVNGARAVGPAIAGVFVALAGPTFVFGVNAVSFLATVAAVIWWRRPKSDDAMPHERPFAALAAGLRYVRSGPAVRRVLLRSLLFIIPSSALWSLLPVVARGELGLSSSGYGLLLAALGIGAVAGGLGFSVMRRRWGATWMLAVSAALFGIATLVAGVVQQLALVLLVLFVAGIGWPMALSTLNSMILLMFPAWVRARGMSVYTLVFMGGQAIGSLLWGAVAAMLGTAGAMAVAAVLLGFCAVSTLWWPVEQDAADFDLTPLAYWPEPYAVSAPEPDDGPVLVLRRYDVPPEAAAGFFPAVARAGRSRQRTGAMEWRLYRDIGVADRYVEAFVVRSWEEHLSQHRTRLTVLDQDIEHQVAQYTVGTDEITHLIAVDETL